LSLAPKLNWKTDDGLLFDRSHASLKEVDADFASKIVKTWPSWQTLEIVAKSNMEDVVASALPTD
jgi:hypothetical protein